MTPEENNKFYKKWCIDIVEDSFRFGTEEKIKRLCHKFIDFLSEGVKQSNNGRQEKVVEIAVLQDKPTARDKADLKKIRNIQTVYDFLKITEKPKKKGRKKPKKNI